MRRRPGRGSTIVGSGGVTHWQSHCSYRRRGAARENLSLTAVESASGRFEFEANFAAAPWQGVAPLASEIPLLLTHAHRARLHGRRGGNVRRLRGLESKFAGVNSDKS